MFMDRKAISTLTLIILIVASAIIGGIISYMLTIAYYVEMGYNIPENETVLVITDILFDPKDAGYFILRVLNPSYSVSNATITRIAVSIENEDILYDFIGTIPNVERGIIVPLGKDVNITCNTVKIEGKYVDWGQFIMDNAGKTVVIHVFSESGSAAIRRLTLPYVKLKAIPEFNANLTFNSFNLTIENIGAENLTISYISIAGIELTDNNTNVKISEGIPLNVGESIELTCTERWVNRVGSIVIFTREGYRFIDEITTPKIDFSIVDVTFNENDTLNFNITLDTTASHTKEGYLNVTSVSLRLDNGTEISIELPEAPGMKYNSSKTLVVPWNWTEYRGRELRITVQTLQGLTAIKEKVITPKPIILKVLNVTFNLKDWEHFNITVKNLPKPSSLKPINITEIILEEVKINGTKASPPLPQKIEPGENVTFYCYLGKNWTAYEKDHLELVINYEYTMNGIYVKDYTVFNIQLPPKAELNITSVTCLKFGDINYLNITVENMPYSASNLTISQLIVTFQNKSASSNVSLIIAPGEKISIIITVQLGIESGEEITIKAITEEEIETCWTGVPLTP